MESSSSERAAQNGGRRGPRARTWHRNLDAVRSPVVMSRVKVGRVLYSGNKWDRSTEAPVGGSKDRRIKD